MNLAVEPADSRRDAFAIAAGRRGLLPLLIDPQGGVVFSGVPDDSRRYLDTTGKSGVTRSYLGRALAEALAGKTVSQPQVKDQGCIIAW
jgi:hypothetical protein